MSLRHPEQSLAVEQGGSRTAAACGMRAARRASPPAHRAAPSRAPGREIPRAWAELVCAKSRGQGPEVGVQVMHSWVGTLTCGVGSQGAGPLGDSLLLCQ